jgi:hypothetical protein
MSEPKSPANGEASDSALVGSWTLVYLLVTTSFVVWVTLLILLQRMYS